ncbi:C40 family peptidase [Flavobacterium sp. AG291]|uniref:C40 family peptidase n=1 Tax=Flavobacterium sp. AG291 TaxID=2184000 RepID=UPI000E2CC998|nr:C40 family peptidase [Flavobacterium sp. AG291]RDI15873.1 cell wall-associated NlpC family hydrolase [Flavobacterium sp. AG291]
MKNILSISLFLFLLITTTSTAQIITTKKEAQKKGVYSYTEKQKAAEASKPAIDKQAVVKEVATLKNSDVIAYEPVAKKDMVMNPGKMEAPAIKKNPASKKTIVINDTDEDTDYIEPDVDSYLGQQIATNAIAEFKGVRYRGGGTTKAGMDCSGMVYATFKIFDITLPRSSNEMVKATNEVKLSEVKKGDLLFFRNNHNRKTINHVGIVTEVTPEGEVLFIHSSTSSGVIISSMNENYHSRTFVKAGRYIEE